MQGEKFKRCGRWLAEGVLPLVDFLYPPRCPLCRQRVGGQTGLCVACWSQLAIPGEPSCQSCGRPFDDAIRHDSVCAPCLADPPRHDGIAAATLYNDASRQLVLGFKHGGRVGLGSLMARLMANRLPFAGPDWVLVPVPLHRWRLWRRGYNQAAVLARGISRQTGARLCVDALMRTKATRPLGGMGRKARKRALSGAIGLNPSQSRQIHGAKVILVDDVFTSGATSDACVSVLKRAGAEKVIVACFARVLDEALEHTRPAAASVPAGHENARSL